MFLNDAAPVFSCVVFGRDLEVRKYNVVVVLVLGRGNWPILRAEGRDLRFHNSIVEIAPVRLGVRLRLYESRGLPIHLNIFAQISGG